MNRFVVMYIAVFLIAIFLNLYFYYDQSRHTDKLQYFVAKQQARTLNAFMEAFNETYQEIFHKRKIPFDDENIGLMPVVTIPCISERFTKTLQDQASVGMVSDRPRNPKNAAKGVEMEAIDFFKRHPEAREFKKMIDRDGRQTFFYASPLRIKRSCLLCHGPKERAPLYIRTHYDEAYGYKEGDLRGIVSIHISQKKVSRKIARLVEQNVLKVIGATVAFLILFYFLLKKVWNNEFSYAQKLQEYNRVLQNEVNAKTVTLQRQSEELQRRLYFDGITDLPNRNALLKDLKEKDAKGLVLINIDDFNVINDFYGHDTGDGLIRQLADVLIKACGPLGCTIYRMPTDEFALLYTDEITEPKLREDMAGVLSQIDTYRFEVPNDTIHLRVAAGGSLEKEKLLPTADMALKKAKIERQPFCLFDPSMNISHKYEENIRWSEKLKRALADGRVVPYFQPIISTRDGSVKSYEALVRLIDEDGTTHSPAAFLEVARKSGYYDELTKRVADGIFASVARLNSDVSMNISYLDITNRETMAYIIAKLDDPEISERIHFEILESEGIEQFDEVRESLAELRKYGAHISLDDFGSGYSNFVNLIELRVDLIKIDGSLIRQIDTNESSRQVVTAIVDFAKKLGIATCAEFVGSEEVFLTVKELGVDYVQGYYLGAPQPLEDLV